MEGRRLWLVRRGVWWLVRGSDRLVCVLYFSKVGRATGLLEKDGFRVRVLFVLLPKCVKLSLIKFLLPPVHMAGGSLI
jgi:hypothetical protein